MDLRHIRYFLAVAEELHFGRAARRLHIAQPPLSRQIQDLEGELGVSLFVRDRRHVALTPAGEAFREEARRLLADVGEAVERARRAARGEIGRLRIGYVPSVAMTRFPDILRAYRRRFPRVDLTVEEMSPARQVERLLADRLDVGFARGPLLEPALQVQGWWEEPLVVALPRSHPLARRRRLPMSALAREPFIVPARARGPGIHDQVLALCRDAGFSPRVVHEGSQLDAQLLVAAGVGVAIVPCSHRGLHRAGVVLRALAERPVTQMVMAWRKTDSSPALAELVREVNRTGRLGAPEAARRR